MPNELIRWTCEKEGCQAENTYSRQVHQQRVDVLQMKIPVRRTKRVTCRKCGKSQMIEYLEL